MLLVTAYPILQATYDSLFNYRLTDPENRSFIGLRNYYVVLTDPLWWQALGVTLFITVVTVAVELVLGFALAMVMAKALKSLRPVLRAVILIPYAVITVVSALAWKFAFDIDTGFVNHWFAWLPGIDANTDWFGGQWSRCSSSALPRSGRRRRSSRCCCSPGSPRCPTCSRRRRWSTAPPGGSGCGR